MLNLLNNKVMDLDETDVCTVAENGDDKYYTTSRKQKSASQCYLFLPVPFLYYIHQLHSENAISLTF